jgi:hypothetical protein
MKLPKMLCRKCGHCCGPVACKTEEYERIVNYAAKHGIAPQWNGSKCPWLTRDLTGFSCSIYPVRPPLCRLFGHTPKMKCRHGHNVNITPEREREFCRTEFTVPGLARLLHEVVCTNEQLERIIQDEAVLGRCLRSK